jgi:putative ABC transport system permease protein
VFNPVTNPVLGAGLLAAGIITGILAGVYPALVLSGFQPVKVFQRMKLIGNSSGHWLRQSLVVIQFALSLLLIVAATIVYRQTQYLNNKDLGFNKEQVVYFEVRGEIPNQLETFKSELRRLPSVVSVTSGYGLPGDMYAGDGVIIPGKEGEKELQSNVFIGDHDYVKTLGLRVIAGRDFSRDMVTDVREAFLINETAVKEFGFETPEKAIGRRINWKEWQPADTLHPVKQGRVIGVVQDFHYKSLHEKVTASVIQLYPGETYKVAVKLKTTDIKTTLAGINTIWTHFSPTYPINYQFMDETYGKMYESEEKLSDLLWIFTVLAIVIGCMGLFGLASLSAEQRTKELGIRKVLGAGVFDIVALFSKNFLLLVLVAALIACPLAWWAMNSWLADFPYRVSVNIWVFVIAVVAALGIALLTVSFQSIKSALANPVKSLRAE